MWGCRSDNRLVSLLLLMDEFDEKHLDEQLFKDNDGIDDAVIKVPLEAVARSLLTAPTGCRAATDDDDDDLKK